MKRIQNETEDILREILEEVCEVGRQLNVEEDDDFDVLGKSQQLGERVAQGEER
jgi:hypothetical protein